MRMFQMIVIQKVTKYRRINKTVCRLRIIFFEENWILDYKKRKVVQEMFYIGLPCIYCHQSV